MFKLYRKCVESSLVQNHDFQGHFISNKVIFKIIFLFKTVFIIYIFLNIFTFQDFPFLRFRLRNPHNIAFMLFWCSKIWHLCPFWVPSFDTYALVKCQSLALMPFWVTEFWHLCPFDIPNCGAYALLVCQTLVRMPFLACQTSTLCLFVVPNFVGCTLLSEKL